MPKKLFKLIKKKKFNQKSYYLVHVQHHLIVLKILRKEVFILINLVKKYLNGI